MNDNLQNIPCAQRPRMIGALPRGLVYFRTWHTLRWFIALALPVLASAATAWMHGHGPWLAAGLGILGLLVAVLIFVFLFSGMSSSNAGTYFRQSEPARFWAEVVLLCVIYIAACLFGFVWR